MASLAEQGKEPFLKGRPLCGFTLREVWCACETGFSLGLVLGDGVEGRKTHPRSQGARGERNPDYKGDVSEHVQKFPFSRRRRWGQDFQLSTSGPF